MHQREKEAAHYYTTMVEWSRALGGVPIHLHTADRQWLMRADPAVQFWEGDTKEIGPGLTLVRLGGHFEGGTVLGRLAGRARRAALGRIGEAHLADQPPNVRRYARPAGTPTRFPAPEGAKASSLPAENGLRLNDRKCIQNARCNPIQADEKETVKIA
jgi:hypothetical protein